MTNQQKSSLGELEAEIMKAIWKQKEATVRTVLKQIQKKKEVAYTTIMTIMSRLYEKGLLNRRADANGAYLYFPSETKEDFFSRVSGNLINKMLKDFGDVAVAQFVGILNSDEFKKSGEWRKKLKQIIK